ncbi:phosphoribosylglycinamide formyltransferase [Anderseniella sp. Alg231-50]|uniref:phosphoribosylglycinamide formyltransferase n=1 Tax=Anderseniella sp. Alg231-50 TaxID=1922226 RepID=UPI000D55B43E
MSRKRVGILISGRGSNMASLVDAARRDDCAYEIACVISNRPDAPGLQIARNAGIEAVALDHKALGTRDALDAAIHEALLANGAELVVCAGFMRIMTGDFIAKWEGSMINIHPSLLPLFKGLDTHEQALQAGVRVHGCSVHFISAELDAGAIIAQGVVKIGLDDDADTLAARVLPVEHLIYPAVLGALAEGRIRLENGQTVFADDDAASLSILATG